MKRFKLEGSLRADLGRKATKAFRNSGVIPAVLYGGEGKETVHFSVVGKAVQGLIYTPEVFVIDLTVDGKTEKVILKDIQYHPVNDQILHMDFIRVFENIPAIMEIPVVLEGLAKGVKAGGRLILELRKLRVKALYTDFPERLEVDVTKLAIGDDTQVGQLSYDKLQLLNNPNAVVCRVRRTRVVTNLEMDIELGLVDPDDLEGEEGAEGATTEGEATEEKAGE